jgi:glycosyltransferase involved in cell wall biosynthesis
VIVDAEPAFRTRHANPYNALLYAAVAEQGVTVREFSRRALRRDRPDIVHLHWPELTFLSSHRAWQSRLRLAVFGVLIGQARRRGTRLLWTVHNDDAHEARGTPALTLALERMLRRQVDGAFILSDAAESAFRARFGDAIPIYHTAHGHYRDAYPLSITRADARTELGIDSERTVLVSVGQIRPYKNLPGLIDAARGVEDPLLLLGIAGKPDGEASAARLRTGASADPRVRLELERLDDARMAAWLRAADAVVLPYRRILNSGSAILALSAGRPVIAPAIGAMPELARSAGSEWVRLYEGELTSEVLRGALSWLRLPRPPGPNLDSLDWSGIAEATVAGYRAALAEPPRRA